MINTSFKSIVDLLKAFPDEQSCIEHLEKLRWDGDVVSPFDTASKVYIKIINTAVKVQANTST